MADDKFKWITVRGRPIRISMERHKKWLEKKAKTAANKAEAIKDKAANSVARILRRTDKQIEKTKTELIRETLGKKKKPARLAVEASKGAIAGMGTGALFGGAGGAGLAIVDSAVRKYVKTGHTPKVQNLRDIKVSPKLFIKMAKATPKIAALGYGGMKIGSMIGAAHGGYQPYKKEFGASPETKSAYVKAALLGAPLAIIGARQGTILAPKVAKTVKRALSGKKAQKLYDKIKGPISPSRRQQVGQILQGITPHLGARYASKTTHAGSLIAGSALGLGLGTEAVYQHRKHFKKKKTNIPK